MKQVFCIDPKGFLTKLQICIYFSSLFVSPHALPPHCTNISGLKGTCGMPPHLPHFTNEGTDIAQDRLVALQVAKGTGGGVGVGLMNPSLGVNSCGFLTPVSTLA